MRHLRARLAFTALLASCALAGAAEAPRSATTTAKAPVAAPRSELALNARQIDLTSQVTGRPYRLFVSIPDRPPPDGGFPVVYVLDGNLHFGTAVDTARMQSPWHVDRSLVVVGIGYQTDSENEALRLRNLDLTMPVKAEYLATGWIAKMQSKAEEYGSVDTFLDMIEKDVKPRVEALVRIDRTNQALMGHSLGGLTTLHAMFTHPGRYQHYVVISPSIWWNNEAVLADEPAFREAVQAGRADVRALLVVGGLESTPRTERPGVRISQDQIDEMVKECHMVPNVEQLGARLARLNGPHLTVTTTVLPDENHNSVVPAAISRGIRFVMRGD